MFRASFSNDHQKIQVETLLTTLEFSQLSSETPPSPFFPELMDLDVALPLPETTDEVNNYFTSKNSSTIDLQLAIKETSPRSAHEPINRGTVDTSVVDKPESQQV